MKKVTAYNRIRKAMRDNERSLLADIKRDNKQGSGWHTGIYGMSLRQHHALDRLIAKGKVRYRKWTRAQKSYDKSGYWVR